MHGKASRERWKREDRRLKYHVLDGTRPLHGVVIKGMLRSPDIITVDLPQGHHSSFRICTGYKVTPHFTVIFCSLASKSKSK